MSRCIVIYFIYTNAFVSLFDFTCVILYIIPFTGIMHIIREKDGLVKQLEKYLEQHQSQLNFETYKVAMDLEKHKGEDDFDFMRSKEIRDEEHEAAENLQRLFRGYKLRMKLKEAAVTVAVSQFVHKSPTHTEVTDYIFKDHALGIEFSETIDPETGNVIVKCMAIHPGTTASYTKLKCFDLLIAVNDSSIVDMSPAEFNDLIAKTGRPIKLTFVGQRKDVAITTMATSDSTNNGVESTEATGIELKFIENKKCLL